MKFSIVMAAFLTLGSAAAFAAESAATDSATAPAGTKHGACQADIQKFCANVEKGKGKMHECLTQHTADLSDGCKQRMAEHASKATATPPAN
jgi:Spy/CpxP family protein refolding chaperone